MRILVIGAGVIGSVYAARLAGAGHEVSLLAHGTRQVTLRDDGVRVHTAGRQLHTHPRVVTTDDGGRTVDLTIICVRATQLDGALEVLTRYRTSTVAFLQHLGPHPERARLAVGPERTVLAFPGIGGLVRPDGSVEYVAIAAQPTTIEANAAQLRRVVRAIREGFRALNDTGVQITPTALRLLFSRLPPVFAATYWRRALRGPIGPIAIAPHTRASSKDEFAVLCTDVLARVAHRETTPTMIELLTPWAGPSVQS